MVRVLCKKKIQIFNTRYILFVEYNIQFFFGDEYGTRYC